MSMGPAMGKLDQFPLEDEQNRAMTPDDDLSLEIPLLIDPCGQEDPETLLGYDITGQIYAVDEGEPATATIDICHLERSRLRDARLDIIESTVMLMEMRQRHQDSGNTEALEDLQRIMDTMLLGDNCLYAGAARFVSNNPNLFDL